MLYMKRLTYSTDDREQVHLRGLKNEKEERAETSSEMGLLLIGCSEGQTVWHLVTSVLASVKINLHNRIAKHIKSFSSTQVWQFPESEMRNYISFPKPHPTILSIIESKIFMQSCKIQNLIPTSSGCYIAHWSSHQIGITWGFSCFPIRKRVFFIFIFPSYSYLYSYYFVSCAKHLIMAQKGLHRSYWQLLYSR